MEVGRDLQRSDAFSNREFRKLNSGGEVQLLVDVLSVAVNRAVRYRKPPSDVLRGESFGNKADDLHLAWRQWLEAA